MIQVSDAIGNSFFTNSKSLAERIVAERDNPFVRIVENDCEVDDEHIVKDYADFCVYFY